MDPSCIPPCVYQFRVIVQGISPLIWRRFLIHSDMSLATLHGREYGSARLGGPSFDIDTRHVPLVTLRLHRGERFSYLYNFIDHWICDLRLEAIVPLDPRRVYPVCTGGKRAAPPEDCGGAWAYLQMVDRHYVPLEAMTVVARALDRLLAADGQTTIRQVIRDRDAFQEAVTQLDAYLQFRPEHVNRRQINVQLHALTQAQESSHEMHNPGGDHHR